MSYKQSLIGYWPLDEQVGSTAYDYSGSGNNGTANGAGPSGTGTSPGLLGTTAYDFDGTDDRVELPDMNLTSSSSFTISGWIQYDGTGSQEDVFGRWNGSDSIIELRKDSDETLFLNLGSTSGDVIQVSSSRTMSSNTWHHITGVFDATGPTGRVYVDGLFDNSSTSSVTDFASTGGPHIGRRSDGAKYFNGSITDMRLYDRILTHQEIAYLYEVGQQGRFTTKGQTL